jgi:hypothetical protein
VNGLRPDNAPTPEWMDTQYQLWYRDPRKVIHNLLANPDLADGIDYAPYRDFKDDKRRYRDFMSGNWAWRQCVRNFRRVSTSTNFTTNRTSSLWMPIHMERSSFPPYSEATKQLSLSQPVSKNTILCISQSGTCTITSDEPTRMPSS